MDKPISLSVKQFIIRKMAVSLMVPEKTIEAVVNHEFNAMIEAMRTVSSVELSGFGRFLFNSTKAVRTMRKYKNSQRCLEELLSGPLTEQKRKNTQAKLDGTNLNIKVLKLKVNED